MNNDYKQTYILELFLIVILLILLIVPVAYTRWGTAIVLLIYAVISNLSLKREKIKSHYKSSVFIIMIVLAIMYLGILYAFGLYFEIVRSKITLTFITLFKIIIPLVVIVVSTEFIREKFLSQELNIRIKSKKFNLSPVLTLLSMVLIDVLINNGNYNLNKLEDFLTIIGLVIFSSISSNLVYNYISNKYDKKCIIVYRLIILLFPYIIPLIPEIYVFFESFLKMLYPYIVYVILERIFSKNEFVISYGEKKKEFIVNSILMILTASLIMLISCNFTFGIMVIGSRSMTGALNKGDVILFKKYENQELNDNQIIIFNYDGVQTIHRINKIIKVNDEYRFYTKGDANKKLDNGYRLEEDIYGIVKLKIPYIGYPTLWLRNLFNE
jgi:signal peptidase I